MSEGTIELINNLEEITTVNQIDNFNSINTEGKWKMLVVDDDIEVHHITRIVLKDFKYEGKTLEILSAHSGEEAMRLIKDNPDTALVLLDVIMEKSDSGLSVVKYIRECIKNKNVRIILRTGQPGETPEEKAIINYDINDYKEKSELTSTKLVTSVIAALRSYRALIILQNNNHCLEKVATSSSFMYKHKLLNDFIEDTLVQLVSVLQENSKFDKIVYSGFSCLMKSGSPRILSGTSSYSQYLNQNPDSVLSDDERQLVHKVCRENKFYCNGNYFIACIENDLLYPILIYIKGSGNFSEWKKDLLSVYYTNILIGLDNFILTKKIHSTQREIVFTLGGIAEARSKETMNHVKRVAEYSRILALGYGLSAENADLLTQASPMHDIGKLAIPDSILNKPGKLTLEEFDVMKTHTTVGYDMLKNSGRSLMKVAATVALQHHEKFDGSGYPHKLKGEEIHIYGRITAIADVFDALISERVYKKAWELDKVLAYLKDEKGKHFDPDLINVFFHRLDDICKINKKFTDTL